MKTNAFFYFVKTLIGASYAAAKKNRVLRLVPGTAQVISTGLSGVWGYTSAERAFLVLVSSPMHWWRNVFHYGSLLQAVSS